MRVHPSISQYHNGCRCDGCRECARVDRARSRARARTRAGVSLVAHEYCPLCDEFYVSVVRHEIAAHVATRARHVPF